MGVRHSRHWDRDSVCDFADGGVSELSEDEDVPSQMISVSENHGNIIAGNTFRNSFKNCQNINVFLNPVESRTTLLPEPRRSRAFSYQEDLLDLQDSLRLLYKSEAAWLAPFPWMDTKRFETEIYFIQMDLEELDRKGHKVTRQNVEVECILEAIDKSTTVAPKRILLQADAGFGKTATCIKIAFDWASKTESNFHRFDLVILVRLRTVLGSLEDYVSQFAVRACKEPVADEIMKTMLSKIGGRLLLLLDGLDECSEDTFESVIHILGFNHSSPNQSYLRAATIMMTTRPILSRTLTIYSDRHVRVRSISDEQRDSFVRKYFESENSAKSVINFLSRKNIFFEISPLMLFLVCYLEEDENLSSMQEESKIFLKILTLLGKRCVSKESLSWNDQSIMARLTQVGELCFKLIEQKRLVLKKDDITKYCSCPEQFVLGCGVFRKQLQFDKSMEDAYEPVHKRFMEHLAVLYLQRRSNSFTDPYNKLEFIKSILQPPLLRYRTVVVQDLGEDNKVHFHSAVIEELIDVFVTLDTSPGKTLSDMIVEFSLRTESLFRLQNWRTVSHFVNLDLKIIFAMQPNSKYNSLKSIPKKYRDVIGHFISQSGEVMCEFMINRICSCKLDLNFFLNFLHVKQLVNFGFREDLKDCSSCQFKKLSDLTEMILRAEKQATCFSLTRSPSQISDTGKLLSRICIQNARETRNITTKVKSRTEISGSSALLMRALENSGISIPSFGSFKFETVGRFLVWLLKCFGYPNRFLSVVSKEQSLQIVFSGCTYTFHADEIGKKTFSRTRNRESTSLSSTPLKKIVNEWSEDTTPSVNAIFRLRFMNNEKMLNCEVIVNPGKTPGYNKREDYLVWRNLKV